MSRRIKGARYNDRSPGKDLAREEICRVLRRLVDDRQVPRRVTATHLRTSQSNISRAVRFSTVHELSFTKLFDYLDRLEPKFRILIST